VDVADNGWVKHTGGGVEGIDSGVNTELGKGTGEHSCGVQVSECSGWCGIGQIVSGHIDGLHRSDGTCLGSGDTFLEGTEICGQSGLIADSRWNTTKKGGHLRTGLGESEDIVDEKKHILVLLISEVLGNSETGKTDTGTGTWGLVHLSVHKSGFGAGAINLDDTRVNHFVVKIVTLTSAFADTSEYGETTVLLSDVVNQLHDKHSLADTSTTEETNFTSLSIWTQKVNNLDAYIIIN
jgi:peptide chain release factor 1